MNEDERRPWLQRRLEFRARRAPSAPDLMSIAMMTAIAVVGVVASFTSDSPAPIGLTYLALAAPASLMALALMVTYYAGIADLSTIGLFTLVGSIIGQSRIPGDVRVIGAICCAVVLCSLSSIVLTVMPAPTLVSLLLLALYSGAALLLNGDAAPALQTSSSALLSWVRHDQLGVPVGIWLILVAAGAIAWLFHSTTLGRSIRVTGLSLAGAHRIGVKPYQARIFAGMIAGLCVGAAATHSTARLGVLRGAGRDELLMRVLIAFAIGNGGFARTRPAPWRVIGAVWLVSVATLQLSNAGVRDVGTTAVLAATAVGTMLIATLVAGRKARSAHQAAL